MYIERKKNRNIPDHIILNILNQAASAESDVLDHYEGYIREVATEPVYSKDGNRTGYYYDEDLAQELRLALSGSSCITGNAYKESFRKASRYCCLRTFN